jgi:hypothetical protein
MTTTSDFPCPKDLKVGDYIEVTSRSNPGVKIWSFAVKSVDSVDATTYVEGDPFGFRGFTFTYDSGVFIWRRVVEASVYSGEASITLRSTPAAAPVRYGATCRKCNEHYEHAEWRSGFVCYGCKVQM